MVQTKEALIDGGFALSSNVAFVRLAQETGRCYTDMARFRLSQKPP